MVSPVGMVLFLCGVAFSADEVAAKAVSFEVVAVAASKEGRERQYFDSALRGIRGDLADLDFDTFRAIKTMKAKVAYGEERAFEINSRYTLYLRPNAKEADGRISVRARIELKPRDKNKKPVNALMATTRVVPGDRFRLGGAKLERGELVLVTMVKD